MKICVKASIDFLFRTGKAFLQRISARGLCARPLRITQYDNTCHATNPATPSAIVATTATGADGHDPKRCMHFKRLGYPTAVFVKYVSNSCR
jgi:hypothetical protein